MDFYGVFAAVIISILVIILLVVLIILGIKMIRMVEKVDVVLDDVQTKVSKLNGFFDMINTFTDTMSYVTDRFVGVAVSGINKMFKKRKNKKKKKEEDDINE